MQLTRHLIIRVLSKFGQTAFHCLDNRCDIIFRGIPQMMVDRSVKTTRIEIDRKKFIV
ncbi:hypothetical protein ALO97_101909 [Pseudomonas syringae pv. tagetis]|nr:hypothetical protein ALP93_101631 [Pseudomonas syringae pv. helianthi]RMW22325.1 hypothetical protein ALO97_101909 [Pseudomonas syringae pv. tagetis]